MISGSNLRALQGRFCRELVSPALSKFAKRAATIKRKSRMELTWLASPHLLPLELSPTLMTSRRSDLVIEE